MKSRVHPKHKTRYRVGNWAEYERALVQRGDITLWLSDAAINACVAAGVGKRSGQLQYSDLAIETALTLSLIFHLPLRQTEGFVTSIFGMLGLDLTAPDHTTLSRRGQHLAVARSCAVSPGGSAVGASNLADAKSFDPGPTFGTPRECLGSDAARRRTPGIAPHAPRI